MVVLYFICNFAAVVQGGGHIYLHPHLDQKSLDFLLSSWSYFVILKLMFKSVLSYYTEIRI